MLLDGIGVIAPHTNTYGLKRAFSSVGTPQTKFQRREYIGALSFVVVLAPSGFRFNRCDYFGGFSREYFFPENQSLSPQARGYLDKFHRRVITTIEHLYCTIEPAVSFMT